MSFKLCALLLLCVSFSITATETEAQANAITVNGQGVVLKAPDILKFNVAVSERGSDSVDLSVRVDKKIQQVITVLQKLGIAAPDIQALMVSLQPWYERQKQTSVQKGFSYTRTVKVTLRDFATYPKVLNQLMKLNVSRVDSLLYLIENEQSVYLEALTLAIADAKNRAKNLADSLDVKVGAVLNVVETSQYTLSPQPSHRNLSMVSESSQFSAGQNSVTASVLVSFQIKN